MLKKAASGVLGRLSPCDVPKLYASVARLPAVLLNGPFEHPELCCTPRFCRTVRSILAKLPFSGQLIKIDEIEPEIVLWVGVVKLES
ncbi:MAG: hypothetical protein ACREI9_09935, partial [Nitrospiraceae bacterium]